MTTEQLLSRIALALGIGLLIGLERGWKSRDAAAGSRAAGIRTFALSGLLGGVVASLASATGSPAGAGLVLGFGFTVFAAVIAVFEREANRDSDSFSATTVIAAMLTFMLGGYAVLGDTRVAAAAAVAATGILAARQDIHALVARITWPELRSVLVLLAMTFIILPIVPDTTIGPFGGVNPRQVWLIAIVLAGVSFLGYAAVKLFGAERGVLLAGLAGGLVSSTAVTVSSAKRAAAGEGAPHLLAASVAAASAVSFARVAIVVGVINAPLLLFVGPALAAATLVAAGFALVSIYRQGDSKEGKAMEFENPFSFWPVVGFAIFLAAVMVLGRAIGEAFGSGGALVGAIGIGLADVDAVTISMAKLAPDPLSAAGAGTAILAAVASNTAAKLAIGAGVGGGRFAAEVAVLTLTCWLVAGAALWGTLALGPG
jgi:uncharacterized membrane protein (DUF4010 family)